MARMLQHECDHLDGMLLLSRLTPEQKKEAMRELRERESRGAPPRG
jgi:peptide deformylase